MNREPWNDDLDLDWSERAHLFMGFLVVFVFVIVVTIVAAGT